MTASLASEHGPRGGDEPNWIQPGHNYGWPVATYGINYDGTRQRQDGDGKAWTARSSNGRRRSPCADGSATGEFARLKNDLFLGGLVGQQLRRLVIEGHEVVHEEVLFRKLGRVRAVVNGPDGYLYVALNMPGKIVRLVPAP